jgi:hypothetical protein
MSAAMIDFWTLALGIYVGGAVVTFIFGDKPLRQTENKSAFAIVLVALMLTWPLTIWFLLSDKPKQKLGPWNS